jgi:nickel-dependent lactate racemase
MGVTSRGTPIDIFDQVARADLRICLGNIEYHYFAGYSGGYKAIMPGVAAHDSIQSNHSFMTDPSACAGRIEGNPVREDIEEAGKLCPADFILNVVLDEKKEIIRSFAGHPVSAHREGCRFLDGLYGVKIPRRADIVLVTPGGYPKDINMYQAQKALDNAGHAVRDGGIIIWAASCTEGLGDSRFAEWMTSHTCSSDMIKHIRENFVLGGHKAAAIAMLLERTRIMLISELEPDFVRGIFLKPHTSIEAALKDARHTLGEGASIIIMPFGGSTLPIL